MEFGFFEVHHYLLHLQGHLLTHHIDRHLHLNQNVNSQLSINSDLFLCTKPMLNRDKVDRGLFSRQKCNYFWNPAICALSAIFPTQFCLCWCKQIQIKVRTWHLNGVSIISIQMSSAQDQNLKNKTKKAKCWNTPRLYFPHAYLMCYYLGFITTSEVYNLQTYLKLKL